MSRYLALKEELVTEILSLSNIPQQIHHQLIELSIQSLEGMETEDRIIAFSKDNSLDIQVVATLAESLSTLIW